MTKKLVLFGAGKIGRSFIGQIFSRGGFEVVFVDINRELIDNLNRQRKYDLVIINREGEQTIPVANVRGLYLTDRKKVSEELADATLAAISVGQQGLEGTLDAVSNGLVLRFEKYGNRPLDIIIGENMRNADLYLMDKLKKLLPPEYPVHSLVGLVETSLGKMVPIMSKKDLEEDPLRLFAEPYNTLIVAKDGFKNPVPEIADLVPKENIKAWVDRKLFIHNLGHVTAAYLGFRKNPEWKYIHEALEDSEIAGLTRETMLQSADILIGLYPGEFTREQLNAHIDDLLERFQNKALGDTVFRVGCDLYRKLGPDDRVVAPIRAAIRQNKPYNLIFNVLIAAMSFRARNEDGTYYSADVAFFSEAEKGIDHVLKNVSMIKEIIRQL
jgi:mannitol-1-phosphate 5-dehydrogenase